MLHYVFKLCIVYECFSETTVKNYMDQCIAK